MFHIDFGFVLGEEPVNIVNMLNFSSSTTKNLVRFDYQELYQAIGRKNVEGLFWPSLRLVYNILRPHCYSFCQFLGSHLDEDCVGGVVGGGSQVSAVNKQNAVQNAVQNNTVQNTLQNTQNTQAQSTQNAGQGQIGVQGQIAAQPAGVTAVKKGTKGDANRLPDTSGSEGFVKSDSDYVHEEAGYVTKNRSGSVGVKKAGAQKVGAQKSGLQKSGSKEQKDQKQSQNQSLDTQSSPLSSSGEEAKLNSNFLAANSIVPQTLISWRSIAEAQAAKRSGSQGSQKRKLSIDGVTQFLISRLQPCLSAERAASFIESVVRM
jgi:hypothetical protein